MDSVFLNYQLFQSPCPNTIYNSILFSQFLNLLLVLHLQPFCSSTSVWPDLANFCHFGKKIKVFGQFLDSLFSIWQMFVPTLSFLCHRANCHCCKWPKIEQKYNHLVTLLGSLSFLLHLSLLLNFTFIELKSRSGSLQTGSRQEMKTNNLSAKPNVFQADRKETHMKRKNIPDSQFH